MAPIHASFVTCHDDRPHTSGVVVDGRDVEGEPADYAHLALGVRTAGIAAFGKVALIRPDGIAVFQASPGKAMAPAFCGNATAAAIRYRDGDGTSCATVLGAAGLRHEVRAEIDARTVTQTWLVSESPIEERSWRSRRVLALSTLNAYALVIGALPSGVTAEAARRELLGPGATTKLAVIDGNGAAPVVDFYNANGRHGGLPQTGLASIALAARRVPWFAALFADGCAVHRTGDGLVKRSLPAIAGTQDGRLAIAMPPVAVDLHGITVTAAA